MVGICDEKLSERLQLNSNLDLATALLQVRQQDKVKKQQAVLRSVSIPEQMDAVSHKETNL